MQHRRSDHCRNFIILPLTAGSQNVLCVWWPWVSNCHSAPPHCSLLGQNINITQHSSVTSFSFSRNVFQIIVHTGGATCSTSPLLPIVSYPEWAPWRPSSFCTGPAGWSAPLYVDPIRRERHIFFQVRENRGTVCFSWQRRMFRKSFFTAGGLFTFSSFEANKDSIPTFSLWYSWSNEEKRPLLKCYFGLPVIPCLVNLRHDGRLMQCLRQTWQPC